MRREYLALGVLGLILLVSGCGSSSSAEEETLSHRQFVHRTQAWCHRGYLKQETAMRKFAKEHAIVFGGGEPWEQEVINENVTYDFVRRKIAFWKSLPPPKGEEKEVRKIIESMENGLETSEKEPAALAEKGFRAKELPEPFAETRELTGEYGPWLCGQA